jgi:hypothetical protein
MSDTKTDPPVNPLCGCPDTPYGTHHQAHCQIALDAL